MHSRTGAIAVLLFICVGFAPVMCAQTQSSSRSLSPLVGLSPAQVYAKLGRPRSFYMNGVHYGRRPTWMTGIVYDVYPRRVGGRLYELRISYSLDADGSRLHPKLKVDGIQFVSDRPVTGYTLLLAFAEARIVCAQGCDVYKTETGSSVDLCAPPQIDGGIPTITLSNFNELSGALTPVASLDDETGDALLYIRKSSDYLGGFEGASQTIGSWRPGRP